MERFRIGFDMTVLWSINDRNGGVLPLTDKEVHLYYTCDRGRFEADIEIQDDNVVVWNFFGTEQRVLGKYTLTLEIKSNEKRTIRKDTCNAFVLVEKDCEENIEDGEAYIKEGGEMTLATDLDIYRIQPIIPYVGEDGYWWVDGKKTPWYSKGEGGGSCDCEPIVVDAVLNADSENPLQNKVITDAITTLTDEIADLNNRLDEEFVDKNTLDAKDYATKNYVDVKVATEIAAAITSNLNTEI